ncbi:MAG: CPBP family intramembrane metalloprotease, partial [Candidatus Delongbacteria bacterium]|nr:CPBP family intramembrane metalloprotease [Candidatus Delongbacteria bacterium]
IMQRFTKSCFTKFLKLKSFKLKYLSIAIILGFAARYPIALISDKLLYLFPIPKMFDDLSILNTRLGQINIFYALLITSILPSVFEEIAFRGVFLSVMEKKYSKAGLVLMTGLMFGGMHLNVFTLFETSVLGVLLGLITIYSGSIFPAMIMHFINNAVTIVLMKLTINGSINKDVWFLTSNNFAYIMTIVTVISVIFIIYKREDKN